MLLDLLFEHKRYAEVIDLYKEIRKRLDVYELFPDITVNCLAFGACYHLVSRVIFVITVYGNFPYEEESFFFQNTVEHFQYAQNVWQRAQNVKQLHRSRFFLAGLAIKQDDPKFALRLIDKSSYVTARFIRLIAHTQIGEFDKACDILFRSIQMYKRYPSRNKPCLGKQMVRKCMYLVQ